jgi:hypothetical protein
MTFPLTEKEHNYIESRIQDIPEIIVAAAVRYGDIIVFKERPGRHSDALNFGGRESRDHGFVTSRGRFVDRKEAGDIVLATGQGSPRPGKSNPNGHLFSEDMWHDLKKEGCFANEKWKDHLMSVYLKD